LWAPAAASPLAVLADFALEPTAPLALQISSRSVRLYVGASIAILTTASPVFESWKTTV
jgi:hypothetical protein